MKPANSMNSTAEKPAPTEPLERTVHKPERIHVPLYSWWMSKTGERFFCIVGIGFDSRAVLEYPFSQAHHRPIAELRRLIREGHWIAINENDLK